MADSGTGGGGSLGAAGDRLHPGAPGQLGCPAHLTRLLSGRSGPAQLTLAFPGRQRPRLARAVQVSSQLRGRRRPGQLWQGRRALGAGEEVEAPKGEGGWGPISRLGVSVPLGLGGFSGPLQSGFLGCSRGGGQSQNPTLHRGMSPKLPQPQPRGTSTPAPGARRVGGGGGRPGAGAAAARPPGAEARSMQAAGRARQGQAALLGSEFRIGCPRPCPVPTLTRGGACRDPTWTSGTSDQGPPQTYS